VLVIAVLLSMLQVQKIELKKMPEKHKLLKDENVISAAQP